MDHFESDPEGIARMSAENWAAEVAKRSSHEDSKESVCIDSERAMRRLQDPFYRNHKFLRRK